MTRTSPLQSPRSAQPALRRLATPHRLTALALRCGPVLALALATALAGCAKTPFLKPHVDVPAQFAAAADAVNSPEIAWWESYRDPVLSELIRRAGHENRDIRMAMERVRAARAGETISRSWLFPSIGVGASGTAANTGYSQPVRQAVASTADAQSLSGGASVSWEIDISGRLRAGAHAAKADTMANVDAARGVRLLVLTDVASNYFILVGALRQLETMRALSAAQDETLRLVTARQHAGLATAFDVDRAQTEASRTRAAIPPLETLAAVSRHRIAVLIGDQAGNAASIVPSMDPAVVPATRSGQPAELLERRPDLLAAQAQLEAANARRQQAAAEWFPRLFLNASFGGEKLGANGIGLGVARFSNVAGLLAMPIFNAGRTKAINESAKAVQSEAVLRYEDAIVRALEDVENALTALADERQRAQLLDSASASAESAQNHAKSLYDRGQIDLLPLLDAQRVRLAARVDANASNTQLLLDSIQLYKALGGGWQVFEPNQETSR